MGSQQVRPQRESSSSPPEDEETCDPEEAAAAAASAAPAASLPTLRLPTLEEPPPPPAAAGGPLVRARTGSFSLLHGSRCACSLSPFQRPAALRQPAGPKAPASLPSNELAKLTPPRVGPQRGGGKRGLRY